MRILVWLFWCAVVVYALAVGALYLFQRNLIFLTHVDGVIAAQPDAPAPFHNLDVTTPDGIALRGWYLPPQKGFPTVVYYHGNADNLAKTLHYHDLLMRQGFGLLLTSYRGYSGNKGTPTEAGLYTDAQSFMDALIARGTPERDIILYGFSLGSGPAAEMATRFPHAKALVLGSPFTSLGDAAQGRYPYVPVRLLMHDKFDNLAKIVALIMPILVINGREDEVFSPKLGEKLAAANTAHVTFEQLPGTHVGFFFDHGGDRAIARWLSRFGPAQRGKLFE